MKYRYNQFPEFQPEESFMSVDDHERMALADMFSSQASELDTAQNHSDLPPEGVNLKEMLAELEIDMISQALEAQGGIVARAADMLGMRRTTLVEKMRKYGLSR